ncbi:nicotinamide nucleotide repair protein [Oceanobacillus picturae]|uniref:Bifunctional NAD(P)H-hydrate repair enzyme n=1 Tax=Oceanobacillus picturae TaxID=171693 RepID=W9AML0_9BACI|nr:bifunctional ADP-dependent NAD(P)H-hydrate dehydratase/NAD(P)H-hydrate epimerase [Oceanobacillus picturae]GAQ17775.1 nicotinamide nucleotide repair protein [Oceanobacillus picturae]CDO04117.1 Nicotinamide nucleotide repair protein [Oceanobacillus picturae]
MYIVTAKEMYDIDQFSMDRAEMNGSMLMENAGREIAQRLSAMINFEQALCILVGSGNNGGDGFVIARTLLNMGYKVTVLQVVEDKKIVGHAAYHKRLFLKCDGIVKQPNKINDLLEGLDKEDVIVDAMVGIGVDGDLREPLHSLVNQINQLDNLVVSVDIPSGLPADEGVADFTAVQADHTFVIGAMKQSAFIQHTAPSYGKWECISIGFPQAAFKQLEMERKVWTEAAFQRTFPGRSEYDHKGDHGKGLVIGGSSNMPGALGLTTRAALRSGAGLVTAATTDSVIQRIASFCPEATFVTVPEINGHLKYGNDIDYEGFDAVAIGIGMGREDASRPIIRHAATAKIPLIIDGDGLTHLKADLGVLDEREEPVILTPHPGEMAMLLDISVKDVLMRPFHYAKRFATDHGVYVVLKGAFTIITDPNGKQAVNTTGNAGLAKGGSGDVLTGIILAMIMQKQSIFEALCNACFVHGKAADLLIQESHSQHDLLASDVIEGVSLVYRTCL